MAPQSKTADSAKDEIERIQKCKDHYKVLKVPRNFDAETLKKNYRDISRLIHPDKCKDPGATKASQKLNDAYEHLKDPSKRMKYNEELRQAEIDSKTITLRVELDEDGKITGFSISLGPFNIQLSSNLFEFIRQGKLKSGIFDDVKGLFVLEDSIPLKIGRLWGSFSFERKAADRHIFKVEGGWRLNVPENSFFEAGVKVSIWFSYDTNPPKEEQKGWKWNKPGSPKVEDGDYTLFETSYDFNGTFKIGFQVSASAGIKSKSVGLGTYKVGSWKIKPNLEFRVFGGGAFVLKFMPDIASDDDKSKASSDDKSKTSNDDKSKSSTDDKFGKMASSMKEMFDSMFDSMDDKSKAAFKEEFKKEFNKFAERFGGDSTNSVFSEDKIPEQWKLWQGVVASIVVLVSVLNAFEKGRKFLSKLLNPLTWLD